MTGAGWADDFSPSKPYPAPSFSLPTLHQSHVSSDEFGGKVLIVHFWATWCGPCVREMPAIHELEKNFAGRDLSVVCIAADDEERVTAFAKKMGIHMHYLIDEEGEAADLFDVSALPTSFLVDKKGNVRFVSEGEVEWLSPETKGKLEILLKE